MEDEKLTTISLGEYEHLKQIKQERLDEIQFEIDSIQTEMQSKRVDSIIKYAIATAKK